MKIIMVCGHLPWPSTGASTRDYHLLKALGQRHDVTLLALADPGEIAAHLDLSPLKAHAREVRVFPRPASGSKRLRQLRALMRGQSSVLTHNTIPALQDALDDLTAHETYDAVLYESVQLANYHLPPDVATVIDEHNIEYELLERTRQNEPIGLRKLYSWLEGAYVKRAEIARWRQASAVLVTSDRECDAVATHAPAIPYAVVPNGVDIDYFACEQSESDGSDSAQQIIFTGTMNYFPNVNGAMFFARQCWPIIRERAPNATWNLVGRSPAASVADLAELPGVTVTGGVPDMRPYLSSATIAIAPLRIGAGTRLKILEALAMGKAVVTTSIGCEGLAVRDGEHVIIADDPEAFALAIVALLHDPARRRALGGAGRRLVETEYSWERCGDRLLRALDTLSRERVASRTVGNQL